MDHALSAVLYDLPAERRKDYLNWFHEIHIPKLLSECGYLWAAHYEIVPLGARFQKLAEGLGRTDDPDQSSGIGFAALWGAESTRTFFSKRSTSFQESLSTETQEMLNVRLRPRAWIYTVEWRVEGPESGARDERGTPAPVIQMGRFNALHGYEEDLGAWYSQERMPGVSRAPGCVGGRKLLAAAGDPKHAVLYEFVSLEARESYFYPLEGTEWTRRVHKYLVHPPGSPFAAKRIWPPV